MIQLAFRPVAVPVEPAPLELRRSTDRAGVTDLLIPLRIPVESLLILLPPSVDTGGRGAVSCDVSNCSAI